MKIDAREVQLPIEKIIRFEIETDEDLHALLTTRVRTNLVQLGSRAGSAATGTSFLGLDNMSFEAFLFSPTQGSAVTGEEPALTTLFSGTAAEID